MLSVLRKHSFPPNLKHQPPEIKSKVKASASRKAEDMDSHSAGLGGLGDLGGLAGLGGLGFRAGGRHLGFRPTAQELQEDPKES